MICGFASGGLEAAADVWIAEIWGTECGPYVQMLHFIFAFGAILAPLITKPFLGDEVVQNNNQVNSLLLFNDQTFQFQSDNKTINSTSTSIQDDVFQSQIWIPYMINGSIIICCSVVMLIIFSIKKYESPVQTLSKSNAEDGTKTNLFGKTFAILKAQLWPNK